MYYIKLVEVLDARYYLVEEFYCFWLLDALVLYYVVKKLATRRILHD